MSEEFLQKFRDDIMNLGNNHYYGLLKETYEERGNQILSYSKDFLQKNNDLDDNVKNEIVRYQYWLVGFLSGQNLKILPENSICE